ncbi:Heterokaryon incompatibility protein [Hyphodiscus hymeniophilus]|uniref:Heterokaryon incompatibility protein n=1 Tax=Hyphodiscus hymeniophilus TaxID=353542 RepID=A0A9P6VGD5_9HELO|nr:Heterokaryon incompatibility protein [Hyphodiscus hymeniophilus]
MPGRTRQERQSWKAFCGGIINLGILLAFIGICNAIWMGIEPGPPPRTDSPLTYLPIDNETSDGLRLLTLQPGTGRDLIRCDLYATTFAQRPLYSALSYTWGTPGDTRYIVINGFQTEVGKNLWTSLYHLRHKTRPLTLWIDAVCIDQSSIEDKSQQIPIMAHIYARAEHVIIWLGPDLEYSSTCDLRAFSSTGLLRDSKYDNLAWDPCWKILETLMQRLTSEEYWKRTWIIQEIGMAKDLIVHFGNKSLPWDNFLALIMWYQEQNRSHPRVHHILELGRLRESRYKDGKTYALSHLLNTFRDSFCSVIHDKVYAFLGLANDHFGEISVNYSKSSFELYQDVIKFQSSSALESTEKHVQMVYLSAMVRRLLSRESGRLPKKAKHTVPDRFMSSHKLWTEWYVVEAAKSIARDKEREIVERLECEKANRDDCGKDDKGSGILAHLVLYMIFYPVVHSWIAIGDWLSILDMRSKTEYTMFWHSTTVERLETWKAKDPGDASHLIPDIPIRGTIVGHVDYIGPLSDEILASFHAKKKWAADLTSKFPNEAELKRIRGKNERLMRILEDPTGIPTRNIKDYNIKPQTHQQNGGRLFLGTDFVLGIVPPGAGVGDLICQFWNSSTAAVLRYFPQDGTELYQVIGRAGVVQYGESSNWDIPEDKEIFVEGSKSIISLKVDIRTLTELSMDTVNFDIST